jgi:hypothetical protein
MTIGEPDFDTPDHIKAAAHEAIDRGETKYTPVNGAVRLEDRLRRRAGGAGRCDQQAAVTNLIMSLVHQSGRRLRTHERSVLSYSKALRSIESGATTPVRGSTRYRGSHASFRTAPSTFTQAVPV